MTSTKKNLRLGFYIAAAFFLFNPNINLLDVLPDCIGYLFLIAAISRTCDLVPHFEEARRGFVRMFWISLIKIPAYIAVTSVIGDNLDNRVMLTLSTLIFAVVEIIFSFSATSELFAGMNYLGERFGAFSASGAVAKSTATITYIHIFAKQILAFLPELCHLSSFDYAGYVDGSRDIAEYYIFFVAAAALLALILGIAYLAYSIAFANTLEQDPELHPLLTRIREDNSRPLRGESRIRRIKLALTLFAAGAGCMINVYFDNINYLPTALAALLFALSALVFLPLTGRAIAPLALSALAFPFSLTAYILREKFFAEYSYAALGRVRDADNLYNLCQGFCATEAILLSAAFVMFAYLLFHVVHNETGYRADNIHNYSSHLSLHAALCRKTVVLTAFGVLAAIANAADLFLRRITDSFAMENPTDSVGIQNIVLPVYGGFWIFALVLAVSFLLYALYYSSVMKTEVLQKYSLE